MSTAIVLDFHMSFILLSRQLSRNRRSGPESKRTAGTCEKPAMPTHMHTHTHAAADS